MLILHRIFYIPLYAQLADPVTPSVLKILVDAGIAVILTIAILVLAYAILQQNKNKGKEDEAESKRLETVLGALVEDRVHLRQVIEGSNETQRLITVATNENTGVTRQMNSTMEGVRFDLKSYTSLHSDSVEQLTGSISRFESQMVAFGGKLDTAIENINHNVGDHTEITRLVQRAIEEMLNTKLELLTAIRSATPAPAPIQADITLHTSNGDEPPPDLKEIA